MSEVTYSELRDFVYLDAAKVRSFAAAIHEPLATEISQRVKNLGSLPSRNDSIGEKPNGEVIQLADMILFDGIYTVLNTDRKITELILAERKSLKIGQFVEIHGTLTPPILQSWINQVQTMITLMQTYAQAYSNASLTPEAAKNVQVMAQFVIQLVNLSRREPNKEYVTIITEKGLKYWCGLRPSFIVDAEYGSEVTLIGQVDRVLRSKETWDLVDLHKLGDANMASQVSTALNGLPMGLGEMMQNDLQARHPDIFIRPLAIYR